MVSPALPFFDIEEEPTREFGSLEVYWENQRVLLPLSQVHIDATVSDLIVNVTVKQTFRNPHAYPLEAIYVFPLAPGGAVSRFNLKVGNRVVKGVVQERQQARQNYEQALLSGKRAALLEQDRDDVFTVQVGNLPPGEEVSVEITYCERLPFFEDGQTELRLPMVVSPRYTPGVAMYRPQSGHGTRVDTNRVPDASRISPERLSPFVDPAIDLRISVNIVGYPHEAEPANLSCSQHAVRCASSRENHLTLTLAHGGERLNRDFILRWQASFQQIRSSLLTYTAPDGETYGMLSLLPPVRAGFSGAPRDVLFIVDRSGSMGGLKMVSAVRACALLLHTLGPRDRLAIQAFDTAIEWMRGNYQDPYFIPANFAGIQKGENYLRTIDARGGTELDKALSNGLGAISQRSQQIGRTATVVLLTDGEVSNESEILRRIQHQIGDARLFTVGIDTAVNSGLLKRIANLGGGTCTLVEPGNQLENALATISREIGQPLITELNVHNLEVRVDHATIAPNRLGDLFAGRASMTFFKLAGKGRVRVTGRYADGRRFEEHVRTRQVCLPAIAQLWAKSRVVDLEDNYRVDNYRKEQIKREIINIAVRHSLLTRFTAFLAVDECEIVNRGGRQLQQAQPVEMPAGWEMQPVLGSPVDQSRAPLNLKKCLSDSQSVEWGGSPGSSYFEHSEEPWGQPSGATGFGRSAPPSPPGSAPGSSRLRYQSQSAGSDATDQARADEGEDQSNWEAFSLNRPAPSTWSSSSAPAPRQPIPSSYQHDGGQVFAHQNTTRKDDDVIQVRGAMEALLNAFEQAFMMIDSLSARPAATVLEQLRQRLLQMLAPRQIGIELPLMQRFLRSTAIDLISSLSDHRMDAVTLKASWENHRYAFDDARLEAEGRMQRSNTTATLQGQTGAFWEDSI